MNANDQCFGNNVIILKNLFVKTFNKNKNIIKIISIVLIIFMYPSLLFFSPLYYMVKHLTSDPKYILILILGFTIFVTNSIFGTLYITSIITAFSLMLNCDSISVYFDTFKQLIDNKSPNYKVFCDIYTNKLQKNIFLDNASKKLSDVLGLINGNNNEKLDKIVTTGNLVCGKILSGCDYILTNAVNHGSKMVVSNLESIIEKSIAHTNDNISITDNAKNVASNDVSNDTSNIIANVINNINNIDATAQVDLEKFLETMNPESREIYKKAIIPGIPHGRNAE